MSPKITLSESSESDEEAKKDDELRAAIAELDTFFYRASHDLRTPIVALEGIYNMLNTTEEFSKNPALGLLKKQIIKIKGLNESIIDVGTVRSKSKDIEPTNLLNTTTRICEQLEVEGGANLKISIPTDLYINTDQYLLEVILKSLIHNSLNYSDHSKKLAIVISSLKAEDHLTLSITDNGIGINEHLLPKLFSMFFRANVQKSGFGLSLYKAKIAAKRLKLNLEIESVEFEGTKASILFPDFYQSV